MIPHGVDDPDDFPKLINARAETVSGKASFREAFEKRRCLVLVDGFYEWKGASGSKTPYRIERVDDEIDLYGREAKGWVQRYSRRWGIENSYETNKDFLAWTTPEDLVVRCSTSASPCISTTSGSLWTSDPDQPRCRAPV